MSDERTDVATSTTAGTGPAQVARASAQHVPWAAVAVFAITSCGLAWLVAAPLWIRGQGMSDPLLLVFAVVMMFTPAIATIAALLVERRQLGRRGVRVILRELGMWPLRPARRPVGITVAAIIAMPLLVAAGLLVVGLLGLAEFDLVGFSGFAAQVGADVPAGALAPPVGLLVALQLVTIPIAAIINAPFAFGEEVGWRGWLLPALRPLGTWPALLVSGAFWGFWHTPLILLGYNFGLTDVTGVLLMISSCALLGILLGWTRLRTGSVWPAVFGHGAFNASAGMGALLVAAGSPIPAAWIAGPLGLIMCGVFAAASVILVLVGQFRRERLDARLG
ncbi:CPBP family intramembrane glutamic endopeptidase [Agromyces albus]|uniref:CPBP family intramembrane metalloprotease n=1 Tax=Agromyces albus TaxID=205332 RepID=A0A4Q2L4E3_9MICO|nr:CPBP family intramembrane glutamic endopeptidase [Agromyces albus]RXZ72337.1 CPBP family intramembrane metalloprotease [Agromyces albus]